MKNSLGKNAAFAAAVALAAACGSVWAQSIPVPASSADSGRRAVVAVTQPNMSNYATKTEVNNAYNYAASAYSYAGSAYSKASNAETMGLPWSRHYVGQYKSRTAYNYTWGGTFATYIDGNGYVSVHDPALGWRGVGYTYLNTPLYYQSPGTWTNFTIYPVGAAGDGRPGGWQTTATYTVCCDGATFTNTY
jgi:hypothetical protein